MSPSFQLLHSIINSTVAYATEEHIAGPTHITPGDSKRLIYHTIDLAILFGGLYYLTHAKIKAFFASRGQKFEQAVKEAQRAREEAEHHNMQIKMKLRKLEESAAHSVSKAEQDAAQVKNEMVAEARRIAERMALESEATVRVEFERATVQLKQDFAEASISHARATMKTSVGEKEQRKLEREFIEKIQVR